MNSIRKPKGTLDILPAETGVWQYIEDRIRAAAKLYGFAEIRVPTFESTDLFCRGVGETTDVVNKEMYTFTDKDGSSLSLRPEGTAGVARAVIENGLYAGALPLKLFYLSNFFRREKPQAGRTRQEDRERMRYTACRRAYLQPCRSACAVRQDPAELEHARHAWRAEAQGA